MSKRRNFLKANFTGAFAAVYACSSILAGAVPMTAMAAEVVLDEDTAEEAALSSEDIAEAEASDEEEFAGEAVDAATDGAIILSGSQVTAPEGITVETDETLGMTKLIISESGSYFISGSGQNVYLSVDAVTASFTFEDLTVDNSEKEGAAFIEAAKKSKITITLEGESKITGGDGCIAQKKNSTLNFTGSGSLTIKDCADDGIKSKGDITIDTCRITITDCGGDGIQGETVTVNSGDIDITTYFKNASTGYYTRGTSSVAGYNTIWESGSTKTERVNVDTGSHKGIKAGTKEKTVTFTQGDDDGTYSAEESETASGGLVINGGAIKIDTTKSGLKANSLSTSGYTAASTNVYIIGSPDDGLHSNNYLEINGGSVEIAAADDGITSAGSLSINGDSVVDITTAFEGIEGAQIVIGETGEPEVSINSNDDGINSAAKTLTYVYDSYELYAEDDEINYYKKSVSAQNGTSCNIYGGNVTIKIDSENTHSVTLPDGSSEKTISYKASGDGIDCNGTLDIEAGTVMVFGQSSGDNSPIDTNNGFTLGAEATVLGTGVDPMNEAKPESGSGVYLTYGSSSMGGGMDMRSAMGRADETDAEAQTDGRGGQGNFQPGQGQQPGQSSSASISAGSKLVIRNGETELINTTLPYSASFLIFAAPGLESGSSYSATIGSTSTTLTAVSAGSEQTGGTGMTQPGGGNGNSDRGQQPPELPGGEQPSGQQPPELPGGEQPSGQQPPELPGGEQLPGGIPSGSLETTTESSSAYVGESTLPVKDKSLNVAGKLTPQGANKVKYVVTGDAVSVSSKGQVKAKKAGEAVITSKVKQDGSWVDTGLSYKVRVEAPQVAKKKVLKVGESINVNDLIDKSSTTLSANSISVKKAAVASVDTSGTIKAVSKGSTRLSFSIGGVTYKVRIKVTDK